MELVKDVMPDLGRVRRKKTVWPPGSDQYSSMAMQRLIRANGKPLLSVLLAKMTGLFYMHANRFYSVYIARDRNVL